MKYYFPKTAKVRHVNTFHNIDKIHTIRLNWNNNSNMDGWYSDLTPSLTRLLKKYGCYDSECRCGRDYLSIIESDDNEEPIEYIDKACYRADMNGNVYFYTY